MSTKAKNQLRNIMLQAWQFVKRNGMTMSEALRIAWQNSKLVATMKTRIVKFYFQKIDGTIREAYGTLSTALTPETAGTERKKNDTVQTYYDTEKCSWRCYKKANLIRVSV